MKLCVQENWGRWKEESPKWLDDHMKAAIPVDWIPILEDRNGESQRRRSERRSSFLASMVGNLIIAPEEGER